jgi:TAT (twin-arginine translocation) pathway signal sequence
MTDLGKTKRRQLLKGAGALSALGALAALEGPTAVFAKNTDGGQGPEGSWLFTVTATSASGLPSPILGLETYAAGGGYTETDQLSFMPSSLATPGHGSWKHTGERTFLLTYLTLNYDTKGTPQGTSKIRQVATLNEAGNAYKGSGNFDVYDVHENVILSGTFTIQATRIRVETPS